MIIILRYFLRILQLNYIHWNWKLHDVHPSIRSGTIKWRWWRLGTRNLLYNMKHMAIFSLTLTQITIVTTELIAHFLTILPKTDHANDAHQLISLTLTVSHHFLFMCCLYRSTIRVWVAATPHTNNSHILWKLLIISIFGHTNLRWNEQ